MRRPPLLLLLGFAALLPLLLLATGLGWAVLQQQQSGLRAAAFDAVDDAAQSVEGGVEGDLMVLETMAAAPVLDAPFDGKRFETFAAQVERGQARFRHIVLTTPAGALIDEVPAQGPEPLVDPASLAKVVATRRALVGDVRTGPHGGSAFAIRAPVLHDGVLTEVLTGIVEARSIAPMLRAETLPKGWAGLVADADGILVTRTVPPTPVGVSLSPQALAARASAPRGFYSGFTPTGMPVVGAFVDIPDWGWSVHVTIPLTLYDAPIRQSLWILGGGSAAAMFVAGAAIIFLVREMRARRREASALEAAERVEALGRLTGGVAHDFNNILMVVQGGAEAVGRRVAGDAKAMSFLAMILASCRRGQTLTHQLLAFARRGPHAPSSFDLRARLAEIETLVKQAVGPHVRLTTFAPDDLWPVFADADALDVALTNLALNARDAMPEGGDLEIFAHNATVAPGERRLGELAGEFVVVSVRDTGSGIDPQHLPHIFDPFFTTKPVGEGTGLGLSQVFGFAKQSGGAVRVDSAPRKGARFEIYLPRALEPPRGQKAAAPTAPARGRVLLVEDSVEVARVVEDGLAQAGFEVSCHDGAASALARLEAGEAFDVALSDVTMEGGMSGIDFAGRVRASWPDLPVVLMTGYSERIGEAQRTGALVIAKPFSPEDLVETLAQEIGRGRAQAAGRTSGEAPRVS